MREISHFSPLVPPMLSASILTASHFSAGGGFRGSGGEVLR